LARLVKLVTSDVVRDCPATARISFDFLGSTMAQIFLRSTNTIARVSIVVLLILGAGLGWLLSAFSRSAYSTDQGVVLKQPIPFSHDHHTAALGIDCRYCHTSVEESSSAGIPPTATCMNCHKQIWSDSPMLESVRTSFSAGQPIEWERVYDLPDFVKFNHSIHVAKGIGCASCHGRVDQMPLIYQAVSLKMEWCLDCHRQPEKFVRPRSEVFNMSWKSTNQEILGPELVEEYAIKSKINCSVCHR